MRVDVAIVGAGSAGLSAYRAVKSAGKRALLIDHGPLGTTCARVGCMPSKLLVRAAEVAHEVARAGEVGVMVEQRHVTIDDRAVMARVRRERDRFVAGVVDGMKEMELIEGTAEFVGPRTLRVTADSARGGAIQTIEANAIVLAVGSSPTPLPALGSVPVLTTDSFFELETLPARVAIVGAGPIALELGQALMRLGREVTLFSDSNDIGKIDDRAIRDDAEKLLGLDLRLSQTITGAELVRGAIALELGPERHLCDAVLLAAGRTPNLERLKLVEAGLTLPLSFDPQTLRCEGSAIFIAGDGAAHRPILHEAADEGRIAGCNAARFPDVQAEPRMTRMSVTFTHPQIAQVGALHSELDQPRVGEALFTNQGRARIAGKNAGRVRLYADRHSGVVRGGEMIGPDVEHIAHLLAWTMTARLTAAELRRMPFYHPTVEEVLRRALDQLL